MAQSHNNIISMTFDEPFYRKMAQQKYQQRDYRKAAEYFRQVLSLSPDDLDIQRKYTECLIQLGTAKQAESIFYDNIIHQRHESESFYELSQLNIELNEPNKAFLFGINYVLTSDDQAYREELEELFEVTYDNEHNIEIEAQLFVTQLLFQYLFSQGRLEEAKQFVLNQSDEIQAHRIVRNLLAMCYLYMGEYDIAQQLYEELLKEDNTDIYALCHYTLLLYNTNKTTQYKKYLKILNKVMPMNDDESFKLGIVLSYLKQYEASQSLLWPLYKKGKFISIQMFNALSFNCYYLGNEEESRHFWKKLEDMSSVDMGYAPWVIEKSKATFNQLVLPLLLDDDSHYRLYGIFLLNQLNGKEILMTQEIWSILENMNDYEKLYLTYLVQGLTLNKLDFIHRGMVMLYDEHQFRHQSDLFIAWIDKAEAIIGDQADLTQVEDYIAAFVYLYFKSSSNNLTKQYVMEWADISRYKLNKMIDYLLSI